MKKTRFLYTACLIFLTFSCDQKSPETIELAGKEAQTVSDTLPAENPYEYIIFGSYCGESMKKLG